MTDRIKINFGKASLPDGYGVEWWEADEHYHFVTPGPDFESAMYADRWAARRMCLLFIQSLQHKTNETS